VGDEPVDESGDARDSRVPRDPGDVGGPGHLDALTADYRVAFLRSLPRQHEAALTVGYELGRRAFTDGVSVLELARIHHDVLLEVLEETAPEEIAEVATSASAFFLEVLATYDMAQR
jgi:hypothetical protein